MGAPLMRPATLPLVLLLAALCALGSRPGADAATAEHEGPDDGFTGVAGPSNQLGQSFVAEFSGTITTIDLNLKRNAAGPVTLTLHLFAADAAGLPVGSSLGESTLVVSLADDFQWYAFDLSGDGIALTEDLAYVVTLNSELGDGGFLWSTTSGDPYAPGEGLIHVAGGAWESLDEALGLGTRDSLFTVRAETLGSLGVFGCGLNPPGSITVQGGQPIIGGAIQIGVDNPLDSQSAGAFPFLMLSGAADPGFPCGTPVSGLGMDGGTGELLIQPSGPVQLFTGPTWFGSGTPAVFDLPVPEDPMLVGRTVYFQGLIFDPTPGDVTLGITDGIALLIGA